MLEWLTQSVHLPLTLDGGTIPRLDGAGGQEKEPSSDALQSIYFMMTIVISRIDNNMHIESPCRCCFVTTLHETTSLSSCHACCGFPSTPATSHCHRALPRRPGIRHSSTGAMEQRHQTNFPLWHSEVDSLALCVRVLQFILGIRLT